MLNLQKKAVVLLMTLMFITSISVLILKNLKDSENFFKVIGTDTSLTQTQITITNVNKEIQEFFKSKKDEDIDEILSNMPEEIPFILNENITIILSISKYQKEITHNVNDINDTYQNNEFNENIDYPSIFFEILKEKRKILKDKNITNIHQVQSIIDEYIFKTKDKRILNIKDNFSYFTIPTDTNDTYISCNYDININNINSTVNMIFKVGDTNTSKSFDFNFRNTNE